MRIQLHSEEVPGTPMCRIRLQWLSRREKRARRQPWRTLCLHPWSPRLDGGLPNDLKCIRENKDKHTPGTACKPYASIQCIQTHPELWSFEAPYVFTCLMVWIVEFPHTFLDGFTRTFEAHSFYMNAPPRECVYPLRVLPLHRKDMNSSFLALSGENVRKHAVLVDQAYYEFSKTSQPFANVE